MPSRTISGRLRSISAVTVKSCSRMGAGPFSRASSSATRQPVSAISRVTFSVKSPAIPAMPYWHASSMVSVEPKSQIAHAVPALAEDFLALLLQGKPLISTTLSSIRVKMATTFR